jgi:dihydroorotate dehydrogenase electron transfer subunit
MVRPGQFFHLTCPPAPGDPVFLRRPMSVYQIRPNGGTVEFLYKVKGPGTRGLARLAPGEELDMLGPLGTGFTIDPAWRHIVVVGRGVGLATLAPLAEAAQRTGARIVALLSAQTKRDLMSEDVFAAAGAEVIGVTDEDGSSAVPRVEALLRRLIDEGRADAFYTCGSNRLLRLLQSLGQEFGVPGEVALEQQMACGLGMCFCCVRPVRRGGRTVDLRICRDGPVVGLNEAMSW